MGRYTAELNDSVVLRSALGDASPAAKRFLGDAPDPYSGFEIEGAPAYIEPTCELHKSAALFDATRAAEKLMERSA